MKLLTFILISSFVFNLHANEKKFSVLTPKKVKNLLGNYPAKGSVEERLEIDLLLHYQNTRTMEDCQLAAAQDEVTLENLFVKNDGPLSAEEAKEIEPKILAAYVEAGVNIYIAKKTFDRPRPYEANPAIIPCVPKEKSRAYPSGHTTLARILANVLGELYPERAEDFKHRADQIAMNRIIGGVHHPSDITAGNKLADYLSDKVLKSLNY